MAPLTARQRTALENLQAKASGQHVDWINIKDATDLVDQGLAARGRDGWTITPAGAELLRAGPPRA